MFDYEYVNSLFKELRIEKRRELLIGLFGDTKQSITYFKRVKEPGMTKLETLADFFNIPLDNLRVEHTDKSNSRNSSAGQDPRYEYFKVMSNLADKEDKRNLLGYKYRQELDKERNLRKLLRKRQ